MTKEEKAWRKLLKKWKGQRPAKEVLPLMDGDVIWTSDEVCEEE